MRNWEGVSLLCLILFLIQIQSLAQEMYALGKGSVYEFQLNVRELPHKLIIAPRYPKKEVRRGFEGPCFQGHSHGGAEVASEPPVSMSYLPWYTKWKPLAGAWPLALNLMST